MVLGFDNVGYDNSAVGYDDSVGHAGWGGFLAVVARLAEQNDTSYWYWCWYWYWIYISNFTEFLVAPNICSVTKTKVHCRLTQKMGTR